MTSFRNTKQPIRAAQRRGNESGFLTGPVTATSQTIDLDDIPSGNTYVKIIGVSSTNQVTTASLTPQSVSAVAQTVTVGPKSVTTEAVKLWLEGKEEIWE